MIHPARIKILNSHNVNQKGSFVIYWMQASQRVDCNHALAHAIHTANELKKPLFVYFGITPDYPEANLRHYTFMVQGLKDVSSHIRELGIPFVGRIENPDSGIIDLAQYAALIVTDRGYTRTQKLWRKSAAEKIDCPLIQVESDAVVPLETVTNREEYAARTIRPKIMKHLEEHITPPELPKLHSAVQPDIDSEDIKQTDKLLDSLNIDRSVKDVNTFTGGQSRAFELLDLFVSENLDRYSSCRNDMNASAESNLSPYLHFGHISPVRIANEILKTDTAAENKETFLEQLIIRRELSFNFVHYNTQYDRYQSLPDWAVKTLNMHSTDFREYLYTRDELESADTHDRYWNAAQKEMVQTGKMHNYMRMYWGKKILEWSDTPEEAFSTALYLNNKYHLDGRDPNSFAGIAWCFGKHDRPWKERDIFGTVRYMNARGLERKFDINKYVEKHDPDVT